MSRLADLIEWVTERIGALSAWLVLVLVVWVTINVLLRYIFSLGWVWAQQLEWHFMPPLVLFTIAYALRHDDHVRVDILYERYSPTTKHVVTIITGMLTILVALFVIYLSLSYVEKSFLRNEGSYEPGGVPYRYVLKACIPLGFFLLSLQGAAMTIRGIRALAEGNRRGE